MPNIKRFRSAIAIAAVVLWTPSAAEAYDPFWGFRGWEIGAGTGPSYGGIVGGNLSYSLWRFEAGLGLGYLGLSAWARFKITVVGENLIPWVRGGIGPDPYAAFEGTWTAGRFAEGGVSYCSSPDPSFYCLEGALGAVGNISPSPRIWPIRPTATVAVTYNFGG